MIEVYPIEDRASWLERRFLDITSTEISILFGCNPYQKKLVKIKEEIHEEKPFSELKFWGLQLEACIAEGVAKLRNLRIEKFNDYIRDDDYHLGASFDYKIVDSCGNPIGILEIKNVSTFSSKSMWADTKKLPMHVLLQVQQQLLLTGLQQALVAVLISGTHIRFYEVYPDTDIHEQIKQKALEYWKGELNEG